MAGENATALRLARVSNLVRTLFGDEHARTSTAPEATMMTARGILIVLCVLVVVWVVGWSAVYTYRRDWPRLRILLFASRSRGIYGGPLVIWAAIAVGTLIRLFV